MKLYGVTEAQLLSVLKTVNKSYKGNLTFNYTTQKRNHVQFTMRVASSHGRGARLGHTGRHIVAACWHAHRDLMRAIFAKHPDARLVSCQAVYNGRNRFEQEFERTGDKNIGSIVQPMYYREACERGTGAA
jgi:hypothetical protein